jgi:type II secretory pathway pseudopilin PulG
MKTGIHSVVAPRTNSPTTAAFTRLELLAVITVIVILAALLFPAFSRVKAAGQSIACVNNLRQLHLAWMLYSEDHADTLPPNEDTFTGGAWRSLPGS